MEFQTINGQTDTADIIGYTKLSTDDANKVIEAISNVFNNPNAFSSVRANLNATCSASQWQF